MTEPWRELYQKTGHQYVEPLEYIPCPGSVRFCSLKVQPEEPEIVCGADVEDDTDLYGFEN